MEGKEAGSGGLSVEAGGYFPSAKYLTERIKGPKRARNMEEDGYEGGTETGLVRKEFAHHERGIARINNGSFGCCPNSVQSAQRRWRQLFLQQPDGFYFAHLQKGILQSRQILCSIIKADDVEEVSLVDNVTTAVAVVLQQVAWGFMEGKFQKGDAVLTLRSSFGAVKKAIEAYAARAGAFVIEVELPFPVSSKEEIVAKFREALDRSRAESRRIRLAVIDHVTSMPSIVLPVKELVGICREEGIDQVFVDGAHAIGTLGIDMRDIGADFYTSNLHKWFFCPPSVAFLYCRRSLLPNLHHPVVSHEYGKGLAVESAWVGNRDYSAQLCVPAALEFTEEFEGGIEGIRKKNHEAVVRMGQMLAEAWGTGLGAPPELSSSMAMVGLPDCLKVGSEQDAVNLRTVLRSRFGVEVPIHYRSPTAVADGHLSQKPNTAYARISYQIYNTEDDYLKFRDAINQLVVEASRLE